MNEKLQLKKINQFLKGKAKKEIDVFCIYQWIDRCYYTRWWDDAIALGSFIPPNSLSQEYQKRVEFLLGQCRNERKRMQDKYIEVRINENCIYYIPKVFVDMVNKLGMNIENYRQKRLKLTYQSNRLFTLEKITLETCTLHFKDRNTESFLKWLDVKGFSYIFEGDSQKKGFNQINGTHIKLTWEDATSLLPILFSQEYLDKIEQEKVKKTQESLSSTKWTQFGHRIGSQAAKIDEYLLEGMTLERISLLIGCTVGRVRSHIRHLKKNKGIEVYINNDIYKIYEEGIPAEIKKSKRTYDLKELRLNFWSDFKNYISDSNSPLKVKKVYPEHWLDIYFGNQLCHVCLTINTKINVLTCEIYIPDSKYLFKKLLGNRIIIEKELGEVLQWNELPGKKASRIKLIREADIINKENWSEYFIWFKEKAEDFKDIFSRYL